MTRMGLYIHYPYCRRRCDYCDFAIAVLPLERVPARSYRDAVVREIGERAAPFVGRTLVSVYFGGGTPSLWPAPDLAAVLAAARECVADVATDLEVTLEANPIDCTSENLAAWSEAGINRLSIGVQSTAPAELLTLGRDHVMGDGVRALNAALAAGFTRVSADVILGTPGSSPAGLDSLEAIADLGPGHLSVYELTFEEGAPLGRARARGEITALDEDALADLYLRAHQRLIARGFEHYEISSYARPGERAVHNSLYWQGADYLGVGASAASYRRIGEGRAVREVNVRAAARYLTASSTVAEVETLESGEAEAERLWLAMRTSDGAAESAFAKHQAVLEWLLGEGLAVGGEGHIRPTLRGFLYADQIAARLVR